MLLTGSAAYSAGPSRILILPFDVFSEKDLSFLKNGVNAMLSTRLSTDKSVVLPHSESIQKAFSQLPSPLTVQAAAELGARFEADYVVTGTLTVFGNSISTDARCISSTRQQSLITFNQAGKSADDVISHIDRFSSQIRENVLGIREPGAAVASSPAKLPTGPQTDYRTHPDKLWAGSSQISEESPYDESYPSPRNLGAIWKSHKFKTRIRSMSVADIDGDGNKEIVFIDQHTVFVYRLINRTFEKVSQIPGENFEVYISVDAADINHNGKAEIFVTNLIEKSQRLKSFVLEWDGTAFRTISDSKNRYYRVLDADGGGKILLSQNKGMKELFVSSVNHLVWQNDDYVDADTFALPKGINIYGFAVGDVLNTGQPVFATFTDSGLIRLLDSAGNEEWSSSETYGGSPVFLEYDSDMYHEKGQENQKGRYYLPQRIHISDIDHDGKQELILINNKDATGKLFSRFRSYTSGHIQCLSWNALGMVPKWKTPTLSGYISDYAIADVDNDGQNELVYTAVAKTSALGLGGKKCFVVSQELNFQQN